jgi:hypothetical protein
LPYYKDLIVDNDHTISVDLEPLQHVFDKKVTSYKYFWFWAILEISYKKKKNSISYMHILAKMVALAWKYVNVDGYNLGVRDHILNSTITNNPYYEFKPDELRRVDVCIGLPLYVDVVDFEEYITKKIVTYDAIDNTHRPLVFANKTDFWEVEVKVSFWVKDVDSENRWQLIINARDKYKLIIVNDIRKYIRTVGEKK